MNSFVLIIQKFAKAKTTPFFLLIVFTVLTLMTVQVAEQQQETRQRAQDRYITKDDLITEPIFGCGGLGIQDCPVANVFPEIAPVGKECLVYGAGGTTGADAGEEQAAVELQLNPKEVAQGEKITVTGQISLDQENATCVADDIEGLAVIAINNEDPTKRAKFSSVVLPDSLVTTLEISLEGVELTVPNDDEIMPPGEYTAYLILGSGDNYDSIDLATIQGDAIAQGTFTVQDACEEGITLTSLATDKATYQPGDTANITVVYASENCPEGYPTTISIVGSDAQQQSLDGRVTPKEGDIPGTFTFTLTIPDSDDAVGTWTIGASFAGGSGSVVDDQTKTFEVSREADDPDGGGGEEEIACTTNTGSNTQGDCAANMICTPATGTTCTDGEACAGTCKESGDGGNDKQIDEACETNAQDSKGNCGSGLVCNTALDTTCPEGVCTGFCAEASENAANGNGQTCETRKGTGLVTFDPNAEFDGFYGNCNSKYGSGRDLICYTAPDSSDDCKNNGNCKGDCRAAYPGELPDEPCEKASEADWQGGCVNGQRCETPAGSLVGVCKTGGLQ
ncbi:MAG: hypothetical protein AAB553_05600 [Patescibacteria group bacterium]